MTLEEAAYIVAPDAQQILAKQKTYVVAYRYEGLIEVKASSVSEARDKADAFAEQELFLRLGDLEMDEPKEARP